MSQTDPSLDDSAAPEKRSSSKRWLVVAVAAVLSLVGGSAAALAIYPRFAAPPTDAEAPPEPVEYGVFMQLDRLIVNPADTNGRRFVMVQIGVEAPEQETLDQLQERLPVVNDRVLALFGRRTTRQLARLGIRDTLKQEVHDVLNEVVTDGEVSRVYFNQYVIQ